MNVFFVRLICVSWALGFIPAALHAQNANTEKAYEEVFYPNGKLRIQAYLYLPQGDGPFPVVIYNHGSRAGRERNSIPFAYVGRMLASLVALRGWRRSQHAGLRSRTLQERLDTIHVNINHRRSEQRKHLAENQPADDGDA
jgi:hypothetical protein